MQNRQAFTTGAQPSIDRINLGGLFPQLSFVDSIGDGQPFGMIGNGNVFVAALSRRFCHRANIAGAATPMRVHLKTAAKAKPPRPRRLKQGATLGESEKFFAQRWWTGRMLLLPDPLPYLFL